MILHFRLLFFVVFCCLGSFVGAQENCTNGIDDDADGLIDCLDSDCLGCNTACGPIASLNPKIFNTGNNGRGGLIAVNAKDLHWTVSNSLTDTVRAAIYTGNCAAGYWTPSPYADAGWITDPQFGACGYVIPQNDSMHRYFSTSFELTPAVAASLRLSFDAYADNFIGEVYLNGVPQGIKQNTSDAYCSGCNVSFTLQNGFVAGTNTLTILVSQRPIAPFPLGQNMGFLLSASASLDSDGDGVVDGKDECPGTPAGVKVDSKGCFSTSIITNKQPCAGDSIVLESSDAGTGSTYEWTTPQGQILAGQKVALKNISAANQGKYILHITDLYGCIKKDSVAIAVKANPSITLGASANICRGDTLQLNASGGISYSWSPAQGLNNTAIANPKASPQNTTTYQLTATNASGCKTASAITITVKEPDLLLVSPDTTMCAGGKIQLQANGGANFQWSPAVSLNTPTAANPTASPSSTTIYKVVATSLNGCKDSAFTTLTVKNVSIPITAVTDTFVCQGDSVQLNVSGGNMYQWQPATGLSNSAISNPKSAPSSNTVYDVLVKSNNGCENSVKVTVAVQPKPVARVNADIVICSRDTLQMNASGGIAYSWLPATGLTNPKAANPKASPVNTTIYNVIVANEFGCKDTTATTITVTPKPFLFLGNDTSICANTSLSLDATLADAITYTWSNGSSNAIIQSSVSGKYSVQVWLNGCLNPVTDTLDLVVRNPPRLTLGSDTSICNFYPLEIIPQTFDVENYLWSTGSTDTSITVATEGIYSLTVKNICGQASDNKFVKIDICSEDLFFPSAFTPNNDGRNDLFRALYLGGLFVHDFELKVFDRWGKLIFKTNNPLLGWDGMYKGVMQKTDTFVWHVFYKKNSDKRKVEKKGTVTLIR